MSERYDSKKTNYDAKYNRSFIKVKHVQFNIKDPSQTALLNWLDSQPSKNAYLLALISKDYEAHQNV